MFHATLTTYTPAEDNSLIKFLNISIDTTNSYSRGIFHTPEAGVYVITWSITVSNGSWATTEIMINEKTFNKKLADSDSIGVKFTSTGYVVKELTINTPVYIKFGNDINKGNLDVTHGLNSLSIWKIG